MTHHLPTARLQAWYDAGSFRVLRGHRMFVRRDDAAGAKAPCLVLIHGFPTASWDWHALWPDLARRFRLVALDLLGFGLSAKPRAHDYTLAEQADLVEAALADAGWPAVHVLAHDYGDTVAQELLARDGERRAAGDTRLVLQSALFLNGGVFPELHRPRPIQRLLASPLGPLVSRLMSRDRFGPAFAAVFGPNTAPTPEELDEFWALMAHDDGHRLGHRLIHYIAERRRHRERWVGALCCTPVPRRFVDGLLDPVSGAHMVARWRALVPEPDVVELPDIGHYPQVESPERVLAAAHAFWDRLGVPRP